MFKILLIVAYHFLLVSAVAHIWLLMATGETWEKIARWCTVGGCATLTIAFAFAHVVDRVPLFGNSVDLFVFLSLCTVGFYLIFYNRFKSRTLGAMALPLSALYLTLGLLASDHRPIVEERGSAVVIWTTIHVAASALGAGLFSIAAFASGLYAYEDRRLKRREPVNRRLFPPLETLDRINRLGINWGYILFSIGLALGIVKIFALKRSTDFSDPLTAVFILSWGLYSALLVARSAGTIGAKRAAVGSIVCFGIAISGFLSAKMLRMYLGESSFHGLETPGRADFPDGGR